MSQVLPADSELVVGQVLVDGPGQTHHLLLDAKSGRQRVVRVASFGVLFERCKVSELILCLMLKTISKLDFHATLNV